MRETKFGKRCLTWVLIMMMTLSLLPVSALAEDGEARFYGKNVTIMNDCDNTSVNEAAAQNVEDSGAVVYEESEVQPGPIAEPTWAVSRSKTATALDANDESTVTLSLPSAEEVLETDIVFVLDKSSSKNETKDAAVKLLDNIHKTLFGGETKANGTVRVGVVNYAGIAEISQDFVDISTTEGLD